MTDFLALPSHAQDGSLHVVVVPARALRGEALHTATFG
jgi:hypothetical protein